MENFQDRGVWIRIRIHPLRTNRIRINFKFSSDRPLLETFLQFSRILAETGSRSGSRKFENRIQIRIQRNLKTGSGSMRKHRIRNPEYSNFLPQITTFPTRIRIQTLRTNRIHDFKDWIRFHTAVLKIVQMF